MHSIPSNVASESQNLFCTFNSISKITLIFICIIGASVSGFSFLHSLPSYCLWSGVALFAAGCLGLIFTTLLSGEKQTEPEKIEQEKPIALPRSATPSKIKAHTAKVETVKPSYELPQVRLEKETWRPFVFDGRYYCSTLNLDTFLHAIEMFQKLGGRIENPIILGKSTEKILLDSERPVYPVCNRGVNSSQSLFQILFAEGAKVQLPHGAKGGMDPWMSPVAHGVPDFDLDDAKQLTQFFNFTYHPTIPTSHWDDGCTNSLGIALPGFPGEKRLLRFGEKELSEQKSAVARRAWMEEHYFSQIIAQKGQVIVFNEAVHIMLFRLIEVAVKKNKRLDGVTIYPIAADEPLEMLYSSRVLSPEEKKEHLDRYAAFCKQLKECIAS